MSSTVQLGLTRLQARGLGRLLAHHVSGPAVNNYGLPGVLAGLCEQMGGEAGRPFAARRNPHPENRDRVLWLADKSAELVALIPAPGDETEDPIIELAEMVRRARKAALGDSNDDEIEALQQALELALARWPEVPADPDVWGDDDDE